VAPVESVIEERIVEDVPKQEATSEPLSSESEQVDALISEPQSPSQVEEIMAVEQNIVTAEDVAAVSSTDESVSAQEAAIEPLPLEAEQADAPVLEPESLPVAPVADEEVHVPIQVEVEPPKKQETREDLVAASLNLEDADQLVDQVI